MRKVKFFYWLSMFVFAVIHLYQLTNSLAYSFPFYVTFLLAFGLILVVQRNLPVQINELRVRDNVRLYVIQGLLPLLYFTMEPNFGYLIPFILFLLVEGIRHHWSNLLHNKNQLIRSQHKEMEQMNETFLVVRKERHDFLKHISAIHYMLENKKHVKATNYLDDLVEGYKETNLSIQGERGTVAGLLHQSYMGGKERRIEIVYDLEVSISSFPLSDQDLVALIGNILENALDASSAFQEKKGRSHILRYKPINEAGSLF